MPDRSDQEGRPKGESAASSEIVNEASAESFPARDPPVSGARAAPPREAEHEARGAGSGRPPPHKSPDDNRPRVVRAQRRRRRSPSSRIGCCGPWPSRRTFGAAPRRSRARRIRTLRRLEPCARPAVDARQSAPGARQRTGGIRRGRRGRGQIAGRRRRNRKKPARDTRQAWDQPHRSRSRRDI